MRPGTVAACIITLNEESRLPRCLQSVSFCDEIIVVDSGSTDQTVSLARDAGAHVIEHEWQGFSRQRNVALDAATSEWVLEIDADEWLSLEAQAEVRSFVSSAEPTVDVGVLPMREHFLGRAMNHSSDYPFYRTRLLRRGAYRHDESRAVHEGLYPRSRPWVFGGDMHHLLAASIREALADTLAYARLEACQLDAIPPWALIKGVVFRPGAKFVYQAVALAGWRDGWRGLLKIALSCAGDVLTWLLAAGRGVSRRGGPGATKHFGHRGERGAPLRVAVIGASDAAAERWVQQAASRGCWFTLITTISEGPYGVRPDSGELKGQRVHRLRRLGPLTLLRALHAERQLGAWDLVITLDRGARALCRVLPVSLLSDAPVVTSLKTASAAIETLREGERGGRRRDRGRVSGRAA